MNSDLNKKIYKYGDEFYSFEEIYKIFKDVPFDKKKKFKDCFAHFTLAQILKKGALDEYATILELISMLEKKTVENVLSKREALAVNKEYLVKTKKLFSLSGKIDDAKISEFVNGEWLLTKLVSLSLGSSYPKDECSDFMAVNCDALEVEECNVIGKNFIRNMRSEDTIFYKTPKRLGN